MIASANLPTCRVLLGFAFENIWASAGVFCFDYGSLWRPTFAYSWAVCLCAEDGIQESGSGGGAEGRP